MNKSKKVDIIKVMYLAAICSMAVFFCEYQPVLAEEVVPEETTVETEEEQEPVIITNEQAAPNTEAKATVIDKTIDGGAGGKEFYTITTKSEKVFYLVIDNEQVQNNVYLLTEVSENDLLNFSSKEKMIPEVIDKKDEGAVEADAAQLDKVKPQKSNSSLNYVLLLCVAAAFGAGAYFFKKKKKANEKPIDFENVQEAAKAEGSEAEESEAGESGYGESYEQYQEYGDEEEE